MKIVVDLGKALDKLSENNINRGRIEMAGQMLMDMNQYVPLLDSPLRQSGTVSADGKEISWSIRYAKAQYYGRVGKGGYPVTRYTTPGTGPRWDLKAKSNHISSWRTAFIKGANL